MLEIGWATRSITPTRPAMVQGQRHVRIGREAMDPITVTALALRGGAPPDCAVFISCDLPFVLPALWQGVRDRVAGKAPELPPEKIVMHATHTHNAMVMADGFYEYPGGAVMTPDECNEFVIEQAADAAIAAWESRTPRRLGRAFAHAVVGHNRHAVYADGHAQMYGRTDNDQFRNIGGYEDHSLDILFTWEPDGTLAGAAIAIPCPAQVDESLSVFTADFWHDIRVDLRARFGEQFTVLPICSAAGDQSPHFLLYRREEEEMRRRRGVTERQEIAQRVGNAVQRALACAEPPTDNDAPFAHVTRELSLTPRYVSREERDWAQAEHNRWVEEKGEAESWFPQRLRTVVECFDGIQEAPPEDIEIHVLRLGDAVIATNPFELFLDYGLRIKARSPAAQTVLVQLAGRGWYLPSERAVEGGGYGAMPAVSFVGPVGGRELVEATLETIGRLFPESE